MGKTVRTLCVSQVPLFADLSYEEQLEVSQWAKPIRKSRGEVIHRPGDDLSQLLVVHRGRVRISHLAPNGQERLIRVLEPGDFMGETSFITGSRPDNWATVLSDVELCSFQHADLDALVAQFPDIAVRMLHTVTSRLESAERAIADFTSTAVARLARYLLDLPAEVSAGRLMATLPLSKKDIASLLGMTPETLSRQLSVFIDAGLIEVQGRKVFFIDTAGLEQQADGVEIPSV